MGLNVDIKILNKNKIIITDNTIYKSDGIVGEVPFEKSDTISMTLIQSHYVSKKDSITSDNIEIPDGWHTIYYVVLPSKEWFNKTKPNVYVNKQFLNYSIVYYTDGVEVYKFLPLTDEIKKVSDLNELISEINNTTVYTAKKEFVLMWQLYDCYINYCKKIFDSTAFSACFNKTKETLAIYYRDLIWMAINVINYLVKEEQMFEALRILELFHQCGSICSSNQSTYKNNNGCECSKKESE